MRDAPTRTNLPLHDMTGGNTFVPKLVKQQSPAEIDSAALDAGVLRARNNLQNAATLELGVSGNIATVKVTNNTGHKLPTGYPEGRRMWINLKAYNAANDLVYESGVYNYTTAELTTNGTKIYECEPGISAEVAAMTGLPAGKSFHFAINSEIYFDNRIPPKGFTNPGLEAVQSPVVGATYADGQNHDITTYTLPEGSVKVEAKLYYQTTTKEYVEFLRDANVTNSRGQELYDLWVAHGKSAPELMEEAVWPVQTPQLAAQILSVIRTTNKQGLAFATALVKVTASNGAPVEGASVVASYTGPTTGTVSGTTLADGTVALKSSSKKNPTGVWCFTLTSVSKTGYLPPVVPLDSDCEILKQGDPISQETISYENDLMVMPNPANSIANLSYSISEPSQVSIRVYDHSGKKVAELAGGNHDTGMYTINWDVSVLPKGIYFVTMRTNQVQLSRKLVVVR